MAVEPLDMNNTADAMRENDDMVLIEDGFMHQSGNGIFKNSSILK